MKQDIPEPNKQKETIAQDSCYRCGTCCQKGGPAFHKQDRELLESGRIGMADVYTIREGEPIHDNVKGGIVSAETDIIKIKGVQTSWTCRFLKQSDNSCSIYKDRPVECRVMKCWDTCDIEAIYAVDRLTRRDLVSGVDGLWELIEDHHRECSYHIIRKFLREGDGKLEGSTKDKVLEMIKYDLAIRPMIAEKGKLELDVLDFLLGRPLIETISLFGLDVIKDGNSYRIEQRK